MALHWTENLDRHVPSDAHDNVGSYPTLSTHFGLGSGPWQRASIRSVPPSSFLFFCSLHKAVHQGHALVNLSKHWWFVEASIVGG